MRRLSGLLAALLPVIVITTVTSAYACPLGNASRVKFIANSNRAPASASSSVKSASITGQIDFWRVKQQGLGAITLLMGVGLGCIRLIKQRQLEPLPLSWQQLTLEYPELAIAALPSEAYAPMATASESQ